MRTQRNRWLGLLSIVWLGSLFAQSDVSLRGRIVEAQTRQIVRGLCGVEFALSPGQGQDPVTYVCFGVQSFGSAGGVALYRYASGGSVQRVGFLPLGGSIDDVDFAAGASSSEAYLALRSTESGNPLYLVRFSAPTASLAPFGRASLGVARVQLERLSGGNYLVVVGTTAGRLRVYVWTPGSPVAEPSDPLSLGTPAVDLPLFPSAVNALRVWSVSGTTYVAAGGADGMVYLFRWDGTGLVPVGKAMYHPSSVSELVVNGSRLAVGLANGQVYVWNYTASGVSHHLTLKEPWAPLFNHSLCALPGDRLAVATPFVRVYSLADGTQVGTYGGGIWGDYLNDYYWWGWQFPAYLWQPYFYRLERVRVLPAIGAGSYFVITAPTNDFDIAPRAAFLSSPSSLSYQVTAGTHPVYALAAASGGVASGRANGALQAPWGTRNVNEPVFALESFVSGTTTWLLGSYGTGRVFAWSSNAFVADVLPPGSPRILYGLRVVSVSSNQVVFVTAGGDGKVELWQWTIGSTTPATLLDGRSVGRPLHSLSVNANRSELAVGSWLWGIGGNSAWRIPLTSNTLGAPVALADATFVAYHPTNPDLLACSMSGRLWVYNRATNTNNIISVVVGRFWTYYSHILIEPLLLAWLPNDRLVGGFLYNGYVGVWWTGADTVTNSRAPDGSTANRIRGGYDRAFEEVYEPHRDRLFALVTLPNGDVATGSVDGRVVRWSRAGQPVATTYHLSPLGSVDFSPITGQQVLASRAMLTDSKHALLWGAYGSYREQVGVLAIRVPAGDPNAPADLRARVVGYTTNDVTDTDVTIRYLIAGDPEGIRDAPYQQARYEASEDGAWVMLNWLTYRRQVSSNPPQYVRRARVHLIPHTRLYQLASSSDYYYTEFPDSTTGYYGNHALSPGGVRVAMSEYNQPIRIFDRSGSSWNFSTPSSTINFNVPQYAFLKFLADDVLAVAYPQSNQLQLDVYQLSGGSWTLRQSVATNLRRSWPYVYYLDWRQFIDAVAVGSVVRVAVACDNGLVFYKLTRSGGVVSLTEVGRSTWAANGYLDVGGHHWVRFSRYNPNILGVANGNQAVVYDLTGLFSW